MASNGQSFGEEICNVQFPWHEDDPKLSLSHAVPQPMQAHVKRLRHLKADGIGRETDGDFIVAEERGWRLGVSHVLQDLAFVGGDAAGGEESRVLGLCYKRADDRDTR
jgi:hypothetical protein